MNTLLKIFYNPKSAFQDLKNAEKFPWMSLLLLLIIVIINNILMIPVSTKVVELTFTSMQIPISDAQLETSMQLVYKLRYLQVAGSVFTYMFMLTIYTLIVWILTKIAKQSISFQKAFELIIHCCFVIAIGGLVNTFILYYQGIENIQNMYEISLTGLNLLTSTASVGAPFYTFLSLINPFYIWFLVLLTLGLAVLTEAKFIKALAISLIFWIMIIAFPVIVIYFTQLFMQRKGLF